MTCKSTSAGAVQLENYGIEAWLWFSRWCRSARTRPRCRKWTAGRRWIIAGIFFAGLARIPRLVPKKWLSERSKLLKRCQTRLTVSTKRPNVRERPWEKLLRARKAFEPSTQKAAIAHESGKLAEEAIAVAEFAFASPREPPPWSKRAQWSCFGFICGLTRTASASDEVIVNGYWSKR